VTPVSEKTPGQKIFSVFFRQGYPADLKLLAAWLAAGIFAIYIPLLIPWLDITAIRVALVLPVILFIPGYSLISALFPKEGDIDLMTRIALSIGASVAVVSLIGLGLNFTPWGIRLDPIVISLTLFAMVLILVAHYTRAVLPPQERFRMPFSALAGSIRDEIFPKGAGRIEQVLSVALILGIVITLMITIFVITVPRQGEQFTEFFILGENRTAADYPDKIRPGQDYPMYVGLRNHEYRDMRYTIETWMIRTEFNNVTNTSRMVTVDPYDRLFITLAHNETRIIPYNLSVNKTGYNRAEFLLFNDAVPGFEVAGSDRINASYRDLHLIVRSDEG